MTWMYDLVPVNVCGRVVFGGRIVAESVTGDWTGAGPSDSRSILTSASRTGATTLTQLLLFSSSVKCLQYTLSTESPPRKKSTRQSQTVKSRTHACQTRNSRGFGSVNNDEIESMTLYNESAGDQLLLRRSMHTAPLSEMFM